MLPHERIVGSQRRSSFLTRSTMIHNGTEAPRIMVHHSPVWGWQGVERTSWLRVGAVIEAQVDGTLNPVRFGGGFAHYRLETVVQLPARGAMESVAKSLGRIGGIPPQSVCVPRVLRVWGSSTAGSRHPYSPKKSPKQGSRLSR